RSTASKIRFPHSPRTAYHRVSFPIKLGEIDIVSAQIRVVFNDFFNRLSTISHFTNVTDRQPRVPEDGLAPQDAFSFFNPTQSLGIQVNTWCHIRCHLLEINEKVVAKF